MHYYEVLVGDVQYHGQEALTYSHQNSLPRGTIVRIALRERSPLGIVLNEVTQPAFKVKPIAQVAPFPALPAAHLQLITWMQSYYPAPFGSIIRQFLPASTVFPNRKAQPEPNPPLAAAISLPPLTTQQHHAVAAIRPSGYHLLHGITGSGKTRVYVELAKQTIAAAKSCIILTPEIGLTAQLTNTFTASFPGKVYVLHSRMTAAERRDVWYRLLTQNHPVIVIGPRSALFAPVHNLGLIVIDESHDQAYKNENAPHYRADMVAAQLASLNHALFISGSATPTIEAYYVTHAKKKPIITLTTHAVTHSVSADKKDAIICVDLRDKTMRATSPIISSPLVQAIQTALEHKEQSLLFLNRRGTASAILCQACGWRLVCTHCDLPLTYHGDTHTVRCHTCGRHTPLPQKCPDCNSGDIIFKSYGTKAVVQEVARLFPSARIQRFDTDIAKAEQLEHTLQALQAGGADIIVGTQMITKGFDLPKLSVVGILSADSSLLIPDYSANERTFQLISQVAGRVGRGHRAGTVIIQTYDPDNSTLRAAVNQQWDAFYLSELAERKAFLFPPFVFLLKLTCLRASNKAAEKAAGALKEKLSVYGTAIKIEGPSPSFHPREQTKYKWQIIIKSRSRTLLTRIARELPANWRYDIDPVNLL